MFRKIIITIVLALAFAGASVLAAGSFRDLDAKMKLETSEQLTMQTIVQLQETNAEEETESAAGEVSQTESEAESEMESEMESETESEPEIMEETEPETSSNPYAPVLTLSSSQVIVSAGGTLDLVSMVESITDDVDNKYYLYRNIYVAGEYDLNTPGEYTLTYYATDSSGNVSAPRYLKVIVTEN